MSLVIPASYFWTLHLQEYQTKRKNKTTSGKKKGYRQDKWKEKDEDSMLGLLTRRILSQRQTPTCLHTHVSNCVLWPRPWNEEKGQTKPWNGRNGCMLKIHSCPFLFQIWTLMSLLYILLSKVFSPRGAERLVLKVIGLSYI